MFAQLGEIKFQLMQQPNSLEYTKDYDYSEQALVGSKPDLQYCGENLETVNIRISFHSSFCSPEDEIKKLKDAASKHQALSFVYGNGKYQGKFVIVSIGKSLQQMDYQGNIIAVETSLNLKEYPESTKKKEIKSHPIKKKLVTAPKPPVPIKSIPETAEPLPKLTQSEIDDILRIA